MYYLMLSAVIAFQPISETANDTNKCLEELQRVLDSRQNVQTGEMMITVTTESFVRQIKDARTIQVWFDRAKIRVDELQGRHENPGPRGWKTVFDGADYLQHRESPNEANSRVLSVGRGFSLEAGVFDVRKVGLIPCPIHQLPSTGFENFYSSDGVSIGEKGGTGSDGTFDLRYTMKKGQKVLIHIDPGKSHAVERVELETNRNGRVRQSVLTCRFADIPNSGIWWPNHIDFTYTIEGELAYRESIEITKVKLNHKIDESVFTPVGMKVPVGTYIIYYPPRNGAPDRWDGISLTAKGVNPAPLPQATTGYINFWTIVGLVLGGVAVFALVAAWLVRKPA